MSTWSKAFSNLYLGLMLFHRITVYIRMPFKINVNMLHLTSFLVTQGKQPGKQIFSKTPLTLFNWFVFRELQAIMPNFRAVEIFEDRFARLLLTFILAMLTFFLIKTQNVLHACRIKRFAEAQQVIWNVVKASASFDIFVFLTYQENKIQFLLSLSELPV